MRKELKVAVINWLIENENRWQLMNSCVDEFREYIYNKNGNFLIGGEQVYNFIGKAIGLLYGSDE